MNISANDIENIIRIIEELDYNEVNIELEGLKIGIRKRESSPAAGTDDRNRPAIVRAADTQTTPAGAPPAASAAEANDGGMDDFGEIVELTAPMLGMFYRAPSPNDSPFVEVGSLVEPDDTLCLIEVMKLFNEVKAGVAGKIVEILADDGKLVEYGQVLIRIATHGKNAP